MIRSSLIVIILISWLNAMGDNINYDDRYNQEESIEVDRGTDNRVVVNSNSLENMKLETFTFKEQNGKNIPVRYVKAGTKVVYINKVVNSNSQPRRDIVIRNPIPVGTKYVSGSAICNGNCVISYSSDGGTNLSSSEDGNTINYIEFYFKDIPSYKEFRMGFRAIVEKQGR
jgi:uncharacterized repeat protein (TIGR01451 family)